ncbi:hypothetical protein [Streptomyces sp. VRA16 Mangrove soil]|uniref:hypothetical protein n=1 Tax=Streptomyces sp. VRA16 Mangrove soil TaxID=2817434 RepID=UPI001A9D26FD|nr:hypothetical protein [Streptomyces sp. VRA16 Mangrove soil]MBO1337689.1 hypothetical protein [Streptomyces sp. VRA16 Mangrove soil]
MFRAVRGLVAGAAVAAVLTACGGGSGAGGGDTGSTGGTAGGDSGSGTSSSPSSTADGAAAGGEDAAVPVVLTADQVRRALVDTESAPQGWEGFGVDMDLPDESLKSCRADTATQCGGFVALGSSHIQRGGEEQQVVFTIYAFKSPDDAKAAMKGLVAKERGSAGTAAKPLKVSLNTDETDAFTGPNTEIFMRLDGTLVRVASQGLSENEPYEDFARLQIGRVEQTVAGEDVGG